MATDQELRIAQARRVKITRRLIWIGGALAVIILGVGALFFVFRRGPAQGPGQLMPDQGAQHVALGTPFEYNSNPPTSGPHNAEVYEWGVYTEELHDQRLIHNLEHGGIWISYRPGTAASAVERLAAIQKEFGRKVIMAPRSANDADIALAAWNHLDKFSETEFSEERVREFIEAYRNRGPEFIP